MNAPQQRSVADRYSVYITVGVTKESGMSVVADGDRCFYRGRSAEGPPTTSGGRVQRIHRSIFAAHEDRSRERSRLAVCGSSARETERPFQLESLYAVAIESCGAGRLKSGVMQVHAPTGPDRRPRWGIEVA